MKTRLLLPFVVCLVLAGNTLSGEADRLPLWKNLEGFGRTITTSSPDAQKYFNQGFTLHYAFNHAAAIASYRQAVALDPNCAMAWWAQAHAAGPNINNTYMDSASAYLAWTAILKAKELAEKASPVEQDLIQALSKRYAMPNPEDRKSLDKAYADAMRKVFQKYPNDADVGVLFADAMMNLRPWDLWMTDGTPQPGTGEIVATIEKVLSFAPDHPGAAHFFIHTIEASPDPGRALAAADVLRNRIPGAGHLVHMPSHIDIRLGKYGNAVSANQKGVTADTTWIREGGFYTLYRAHNFHFLSYAAMFDGQKELSINAARDMLKQIPLETVREFIDFLDGFIAVPYHVMVRFGMWEEILTEPKPPDDLLVTVAFWHYARTVAYAALGRVGEATKELAVFKGAYNAVPDTRMIGNNSARVVLDVGLPMAEGEVEYRKGNHSTAYELLRVAVKRDDALRYDEPWGWMMPVRHALGALLLDQGLIKEAEAVYAEDLKLHPNNGWALKGLAECYDRSGRKNEAAETTAKFNKVWERSDIKIAASCFCRTGTDE